MPALEKRSAALGFIFVTLLLDVVGIGIIIPVMPRLIEQLIQGDLSDAARYGGWMTFAYSAMQFIFAPVLGNLSDRYGRRPVLLFSLFGFGLDYLFLAFAPSIAWLFVGRIISGITGASFTTASAYIADISPPEKRAQNFGLVGAAFGLGFILGPALGGELVHYGARVPFLVAAGLSLLNLAVRLLHPARVAAAGEPPPLRAAPGQPDRVAAEPAALPGHCRPHRLADLHLPRQPRHPEHLAVLQHAQIWLERNLGGALPGLYRATDSHRAGRPDSGRQPPAGQQALGVPGLFLVHPGFCAVCLRRPGLADVRGYGTLLPGRYCRARVAGHYFGPGAGQPAGRAARRPHQPHQRPRPSSDPPAMTNLFAYFTSPAAPVQFPGAPFLAGAALILVSVLLAARSLATYVQPTHDPAPEAMVGH